MPFSSVSIVNFEQVNAGWYKVYSNLSGACFSDLFIRHENTHNFRRNRGFQLPIVNTVWKGYNSMKYFRPVVWVPVLSECKCTKSL